LIQIAVAGSRKRCERIWLRINVERDSLLMSVNPFDLHALRVSGTR